jgi:hypothetical protein
VSVQALTLEADQSLLWDFLDSYLVAIEDGRS